MSRHSYPKSRAVAHRHAAHYYGRNGKECLVDETVRVDPEELARPPRKHYAELSRLIDEMVRETSRHGETVTSACVKVGV